MIKSKVDALESRANTSIAELQTSLYKFQSETLPQQVNEMVSQMINMAGKFAERMDSIERKVIRIGKYGASTAAPPQRGLGSAASERKPWGFAGTACPQAGGAGCDMPRDQPTVPPTGPAFGGAASTSCQGGLGAAREAGNLSGQPA